MPDGHLNADGTVRLNEPDTNHRHPQRIAQCPLCDQDGYRAGAIVCDHHDYATETINGRALAQQTLAQIQQRKAATARATSPPADNTPETT